MKKLCIIAGTFFSLSFNAQATAPTEATATDNNQNDAEEATSLIHLTEPPVAADKNITAQLQDLTEWFPEGLSLGALVELSQDYRDQGGDHSRDFTVATVELFAHWQMTEWISGEASFLYEENDTQPMDVDQAFLTIGNTESFPFFTQLGKMYLPFGNYDSAFISDPVALELGETHNTAALFGFEKNGWLAGHGFFF